MAHYAFINLNNQVVEVISGVDETELIEGIDPEKWYANYRGMTCVRTSYNSRNGIHYNDDGEPSGKLAYRYTFAGIGYGWDGENFIPPPHKGAIWNGSAWEPSIESRLKEIQKHLNIIRQSDE